ncbi:MAG: hypothetical protein RMI83_02110 [Desulfurococcaceae archaeon]|nr:hypothetical protein [Sulfolobales archaeon]MDW8169881.1 hypothetical protein [Desulfurococcaceae archaeon]
MRAFSLNELAKYVKNYIMQRSPGLMESLDMIAVFSDVNATSLIELFFKDPSKTFQLLVKHYGSVDTAIFIFINFLVKPLLIRLDKLALLDQVVEAAIRDKEEFYRLIELSP